jgi:coproporphyrinogen III oxidase-like Fe-S oxidoreductase
MVATHQIHNPENWLKATNDKGFGTAKRRLLDQAERAEEILILGLRLAQGIDLKSIEQLTGINLLDHVNKGKLVMLKNYGFMRPSTTHLLATPKGLMQLNSVIAKLVD